MDAPIEWLLEGESFIEYRTRLDLLGQTEEETEVVSARRSMLVEKQVRELVSGLQNWPGKVIASHKSAGQPFHKLTFLADLGLQIRDPGIDSVIEKILEHQEEGGPFQLPMNISENYGGTGQDTWAWALCDAPLLLYALAKFGMSDHPAVLFATRYLAGLVRENGWPCVVSKALGKFHGPGRKDDPCPFATLAMLKALSEFESFRDSPASYIGAETLLALWDDSRSRHPYMFFMGDDFRKFKVPLVWYDLVHELDVLSKFPWLKQDRRLLNMMDVMTGRMDQSGSFTIDSAWTAWKDWEFGQKKTPSRWLTLTAWRIIHRLNE